MATSFQLKTRFPEFTPVSDALLDIVLAETSAEIGDAWAEGDRARAQMLLAAHRLSLEGEPGRTLTGQGAAAVGMVKRDKVGDVETEFATPTDAGVGGYGLTAYGREYRILLARNFPAIAVV